MKPIYNTIAALALSAPAFAGLIPLASGADKLAQLPLHDGNAT